MEEHEIAKNENALSAFANSDFTDASYAANEPLERILQEIQHTGILYYNWNHLKTVILYKIKTALASYDLGASSNEEMNRNDLFNTILARTSPPFTLQRLMEVILQPTTYYRKSSKFLNAISKLMEVTSIAEIKNPRIISS